MFSSAKTRLMAVSSAAAVMLLSLAASVPAAEGSSTSTSPGMSAAASGPSCGTPNDKAPYCYVLAEMSSPDNSSGAQILITSMQGVFTVPKSLNVKAPAYTIAQIALTYGLDIDTIELGWMVFPKGYPGSDKDVPHLFVAFRRFSFTGPGYCQVGGEENTCGSDFESLTSKNIADWPIAGPTAFFYVGYDSKLGYWYIQYQNHYIARMSENWWGGGYTGGDDAQWFGEVHTNGFPCTPMGNGLYGTAPKSASISDMEYGIGGPTLLPASVRMDPPTYTQYWDSNRPTGQTFASSFRFGGPGDCKRDS
jgi:hypothetical protein